MPQNYLKLAQGAVPTTGPGQIIYTGTASTQTIIKHLRVVNTTGGAINFTLFDGGTATTNQISATLSIPAGGDYTEDVTICVAAAVNLYALASGAGLTFTLYGAQMS